MNDTEKVMSWLEDEESKFIFQKRVEYNETGDYSAIRAIVDRYLPQLQYKRYYPGIGKELVEKVRSKKKIVIFGAGLNGGTVNRLLTNAGIQVDSILDNDELKWGNTIHGLKVNNPGTVDYENIDAIIITPYAWEWIDKIHNQLIGYGVDETTLIDYRDYCPYMLEAEQYFDDEIIKLGEEEVFIDGGVLDLGTSMQFEKFCIKHGVKKCSVHAFEPDHKSFVRCQNILKRHNGADIHLYNAGLWSSNTTLSFDERGTGDSRIVDSVSDNSVEVVALDNRVSDKVTFIKMDIEGAELEALKGAANIIKTYKPKLAICIYHKKEDMTKIPMYIKELVSEYKLYVRHYSNDAGETVLYAVV